MQESQVDIDFGSFPQQDPSKAPPPEKKKRGRPKKQPADPAQVKAVTEIAENKKLEDTTEQRAQLVRLINRYYEKMPQRISYRPPQPPSMRMTLEQLEEIKHNIEMDLNATGALETAAMTFEYGLGAVQDVTRVWNPLGLALSGPVADIKGSLAATREHWMPLIEEFAIKYERMFAVGVEKRLLFFAGSLILRVHRANKMAPVNMDASLTPEQEREASELFKDDE